MTTNLNFSFKNGYTHGGIFHADDVFSAALLEILKGYKFMIVRGFNPPSEDNPDTIVFDIGGGRFDHHGGDYDARPNGVPYAAFGKLWRRFGRERFGDYVYKKVDSTLVQEIDAYDNGVVGSQSNISRFIHNLNPSWDDEYLSLMSKDQLTDKRFEDATAFAKEILMTEIKAAQSVEHAAEYVSGLISRRMYNEILVLDKYVPWMGEAFKIPELLFCAFPGNRDDGAWNLQVIPKTPGTREPRLDVPTYWKGYNVKNGGAAPVDGMTFCHPSGFLSAFDTLEHAINAANKAIEFSKLEMPKPDVQGLPNDTMPSVDGEAVDLLFSNTAIVNRLPIEDE